MTYPATILVVEDNRPVRMGTALLLRKAGYRVVEAKSGQEGLNLTCEICPNLVLLDVSLPDADGWEICRRIKQKAGLSAVFVAILSGTRISDEDQTLAYSAGADAYMLRPIADHDLLTRIASFLQTQHARQALLESEERLHSIVASMDDLVFVFDVEDRFLNFYQPKADSLLIPPEKFLGKHYDEVMPQHICELFKLAMTQAKAGEGAQQFEYPMGIKGRDKWFNANLSARYDKTGRLQGTTCVVRDITARKEMEENLRHSREHLEFALNAAGAGAFYSEPQRNYLEWDARSSALFGLPWPHPEAASPHWVDFVHPEDMKSIKEVFEHALTSCDRFHLEYRILREGSEVRHIRTQAYVQRDRDGKAAQVCGLHFDITEQEHAEAELVRTRETANRAKSTFLTNMSHELRTPLNAIMGFAQLLAQHENLPEEDQRMAAAINRNGEYLLSMINDILDLARIEEGHYKILPVPCEIHSLLQSIHEVFTPRTQSKGLQWKLRIARTLPAQVRIDENRLRQILMNLVSNAVKFTPENGQVGLHADYGDNKIRIMVKDTGPGIEPEYLEMIFKPFNQIGDTEHKKQGTGLGLAISRNLVKLMHGSLEVESTPGQGSLFSLEIPAPALAPPLIQELRGEAEAKTEQSEPVLALTTDEPLSVEQAERLLQLAKWGDIRALDAFVAELQDCPKLAAQLRQEIKAFHIQNIRRLAERYLN